MKIKLPEGIYTLKADPLSIRKPKAEFNRVAFAAAHVVADAMSNADPSGPPAIDWERRRSPSAAICSTSASASPRRWTPPSAAWASTGRGRAS
jgi:hypothetical protein